MYEIEEGKQRKLKIPEVVGFLVLSLTLNALGNGLAVSTNMGSALWTASAANTAVLFGINIGPTLIGYGVLLVIVNAVILKRVDVPRILGNLLFVLFFGSFVGLFTKFFSNLGLPNFPLPGRIAIDIFGILLIGVAISLYQRVNLILHPGDDLTNIIRFKFANGSAVKAQLLNFSIPLVIVLILFFIQHKLVSVNVGTVFALFFQGSIIGFSDKHIFPKLKHYLH
jgi:uncharacterized membrane protein YczE